jgi:hypothetical protein
MRSDLRRAAILFSVAALPVLAGGCSHDAARGGLIGGAGGAVVGSATGLGTTEGALIGGTAGAVIGDDDKKK